MPQSSSSMSARSSSASPPPTRSSSPTPARSASSAASPFSAAFSRPPSREVLETLRERIVSGRFPEGACLPSERSLAEEFRVSRVVVREAARKLEQLGLVRIQHGVGVRVTNDVTAPVRSLLTSLIPKEKERLRQGAQARLVVEPELAALAAQKATPAKAERLRKVWALMSGHRSLTEAVDADIAFHQAIAELAGNRALALMLDSVVELGRTSRQVTLAQVGVPKAVEQHAAILKAIEKGDAAAARRAMKRHLQAALEDLA